MPHKSGLAGGRKLTTLLFVALLSVVVGQSTVLSVLPPLGRELEELQVGLPVPVAPSPPAPPAPKRAATSARPSSRTVRSFN